MFFLPIIYAIITLVSANYIRMEVGNMQIVSQAFIKEQNFKVYLCMALLTVILGVLGTMMMR